LEEAIRRPKYDLVFVGKDCAAVLTGPFLVLVNVFDRLLERGWVDIQGRSRDHQGLYLGRRKLRKIRRPHILHRKREPSVLIVLAPLLPIFHSMPSAASLLFRHRTPQDFLKSHGNFLLGQQSVLVQIYRCT
jgi:hypothetical protein